MLKAAFALAVSVGVILLAYSLIADPQVAPIQAVRSYIAGEAKSAPPPAPAPETKPAVDPKRTPPARNRASSSSAASRPEKTAAPAATAPVRTGPRPTALLPPVRIAPPPPRKTAPVPPSHYLPGNTTEWMSFGIRVQGPTVVLARGSVATPDDSAGPNGLTNATRERQPEFAPAPGRNERALDSAPYLSLIGRICASGRCTPPFFIGTGAVLCPSELQMTGELQLWTNNYVRELGVETVNPFRAANGGFYLHGEPAPAESCAGAGTAPGPNAPALTPGSVMRKPEFRIANSQTFWKPFFLPLDQPLVIRAAGTIQARGVRTPLTPDGMSTPPSMADVRTETELYAPSLPYGALIGRLCRVESCSEPFVIGKERTICPREAGGRHLELWINHVITLPRPTDPNRPPSFHIFEWQNRSGEFTFEIESARAGCGS
jgi:hypothetical protein